MIRRLLNRIYPTSEEYTVTLLGLDSAGKTTLLYLLKLGDVIRTTPSIGFNVETVQVPSTTGPGIRMTAWDVGWGCSGGIPFPLLAHYTSCTDALIWVVDSCDQHRLPESVESFIKVLSILQSSAVDIQKDKNIPILMLANKQDLPGAMSPDEIRNAFAAASSGHTLSVFKTSLTCGLVDGGLSGAFDWLALALKSATGGIPKRVSVSRTVLDVQSPNTLAEKFESWLARAEMDSSPQDFIAQFQANKLPAWDHYTHIRIAYVILTMYGRQKGKNMIFDGIRRYITESTQTRGRTYHVTMTYFWVQLVHLGIRSMPPMPSHNISESTDSTATLVDKKSTADYSTPSPEDFARFVLLNPYVVDGNYWSKFYSKQTMMSLEAKAHMVLPDKRPLPNLVVRDAITILGERKK